MSYTITVLCENTVAIPTLIGEHGFSAYVETPDTRILFDTGQGYGLVHNSSRLRKDLAEVDKLVLSHGHFDHTGGILEFLSVHGPCEIVAHPDVMKERFRLMPGGDKISIGIPWRESYLTTRGARFRWETAFKEIAPDVYITGEVPRVTEFEIGDPRFMVKQDGNQASDRFLDDYSLILKTPKGLIIILGCAHSGLINILKHAIASTKEEKIYAILGGTHLGFSPKSQVERTIEELHKFDIEILAVSHCTGQKPSVMLATEFKDRFTFAPVGFTLKLQ